VQEVRVASWAELHEALFAASWQPSLGRFRSDLAFRGRGDAADDLRTRLVRLGGDAATLERYLLRNFRKYARRGDVPFDSTWNWLALAQHHGLPTRLLDWTYSPYVALHFATANLNRYDVDAVVWCVDYVRAHERAPEPLRTALERDGANVFTADLLDAVAPDVGALAALAPEPFALFLEPPSLDDRIVNQYALFSLVSQPTVTLGEWLREHDDLVRRVVVPAELKWEVRDKLDQANVTERVLFPGLDGLSAWLTRYYLPRSDNPAGAPQPTTRFQPNGESRTDGDAGVPGV
jgi:hypothetical protein